LEKIIQKHIIKHTEENKLSSDNQYGFWTRRSCALQLLNVLEEWNIYMENYQSWDTIYLDIEKAFEKVPHVR
jgi:hypothetical protein